MLQYINKLLLLISLFCLIMPELHCQPELITNGGFEIISCNATCITGAPDECCRVPCKPGDFEYAMDDGNGGGWDLLYDPFNIGNNEADLFDRRWVTPVGQSACITWTTKLGVPDNYYTDDYGSPVEHRGGSSAGLRYAALQSGPAYRNDGIAYKLSHPLKSNFVYKISFYAYNVGEETPEIMVRLGTDNKWSTGVVHHAKEIDESGWQLVELEFFVFFCDIDWVMIRLAPPINPFAKRRVFLDDFSMLETCKEVCSATYGPLIDNVYSNNIHTLNNPLTFFNLDDVKEFELQIFTLQSALIRTIHIINPASKVSWDGKDNNNVVVANTGYVYKVILSNDCRCREFTHSFVKQEITRLFDITGVNFDGALMLSNLHNVTRLKVSIKQNNSLVREFEIINPQDSIIWDGKTAMGVDVAFGTYAWEVTASNICGEEQFTGDFSKTADIDPTAAPFSTYLDYSPVPKPYITCSSFSYNYNSFSRPPQACCSAQPYFYIEYRDIEGQWDYILINTIVAGPDVTVKAGSDVLFQAGYEIALLPGFSVEPGTIFDAVIDDCTPTGKLGIAGNPGPCPADMQHTSDFLVYPNPGNGHYIFEPTSGSMPTSIQVLDILGTVIREYNEVKGEKIIVDITGRAQGVYFIKAKYPGGAIVVKKIIHQ